jgi:hypothetical protein
MASQQEQNGREDNATGKANRTLCSCCAGGRFFKIRVRGHLDGKWSDWLEGLEVKLFDNGEMILSGTLVDQAALMGVLNKLNGLNLTLLSVSQVNQSDLN